MDYKTISEDSNQKEYKIISEDSNEKTNLNNI